MIYFEPLQKFWKDKNIFPTLQDYNNLILKQETKIISANGAPIKAIMQRKKSLLFEEGYEPSIYLRGELQTREQNWHDFFNLMVWLSFPKTKPVVNKWQYLSLKKRFGHQSQRTHLENLLTQFDEGGMIVLCSNPLLVDLLKKHQWKTLFWHHREAVCAEMVFYIFGHAIYEKMLNPYIGITACSLIFERDNTSLDKKCADYLDNERWCENVKTLYPVPILGIPGWYPANENPDFYENKAYFRS